MGGRGASSSIKKTEYIVVSMNNGNSSIVERFSNKTIAENISLQEADRNSTLLNNKKVTLEDLGYKQETKKKSSLLKSKSEQRKAKIEYAISIGNYNYLPSDITDKELAYVKKKINK